MARKAKKKRAWTATDVRNLKGLAKEKTSASKIAKSLKRTVGGNSAKSIFARCMLRFARVVPKAPALFADQTTANTGFDIRLALGLPVPTDGTAGAFCIWRYRLNHLLYVRCRWKLT